VIVKLGFTLVSLLLLLMAGRRFFPGTLTPHGLSFTLALVVSVLSILAPRQDGAVSPCGSRAGTPGMRRTSSGGTLHATMSDRINELASELERITQGTRAAFGGLSRAQLNWKPAADRWSVAQCLDHLITINSLYFPLLASMRSGPATPTLWERCSPLSGLLGRLLIRTLSPDSARKTKTSAKAEPSTSAIDDILDRFAHHQAGLIEHLRQLPPGVDLRGTIVTSPLLRWVTYSLDDCLTMLVVHEKRHILQAERVMATEGFPGPVASGPDPGAPRLN
jgi:hypothetical protein